MINVQLHESAFISSTELEYVLCTGMYKQKMGLEYSTEVIARPSNEVVFGICTRINWLNIGQFMLSVQGWRN